MADTVILSENLRLGISESIESNSKIFGIKKVLEELGLETVSRDDWIRTNDHTPPRRVL